MLRTLGQEKRIATRYAHEMCAIQPSRKNVGRAGGGKNQFRWRGIFYFLVTEMYSCSLFFQIVLRVGLVESIFFKVDLER